MPRPAPRPCSVCERPWRPKHRDALCCCPQCSTVLSALKRLKRHLGPWKTSQRDQWTRLVIRAARVAWKA